MQKFLALKSILCKQKVKSKLDKNLKFSLFRNGRNAIIRIVKELLNQVLVFQILLLLI